MIGPTIVSRCHHRHYGRDERLEIDRGAGENVADDLALGQAAVAIDAGHARRDAEVGLGLGVRDREDLEALCLGVVDVLPGFDEQVLTRRSIVWLGVDHDGGQPHVGDADASEQPRDAVHANVVWRADAEVTGLRVVLAADRLAWGAIPEIPAGIELRPGRADRVVPVVDAAVVRIAGVGRARVVIVTVDLRARAALLVVAEVFRASVVVAAVLDLLDARSFLAGAGVAGTAAADFGIAVEALPLVAGATVVHNRIVYTDRTRRAFLVERALDAEGILEEAAFAVRRVATEVVRAGIVVVAVLPLVLAAPVCTAGVGRAQVAVVAGDGGVLAEVLDAGTLAAGVFVSALLVLLAPTLGVVAVGVRALGYTDLRRLALCLVHALAGLPFAVVVGAGVAVVAVRVLRAGDAPELDAAVGLVRLGTSTVVRLVLDVSTEFAGVDGAGDAVVDEQGHVCADVFHGVADLLGAGVTVLAVRVLDAAAWDLRVRPAVDGIAVVVRAVLAIRLLDAYRLAVAEEQIAGVLAAGVATDAVADRHAAAAEAGVIRAGDTVVADHGLVNACLVRVAPVDGARIFVAAFAVARAFRGMSVAAAGLGASVLGGRDAIVAGDRDMLAAAARGA